MNNNNYNTIEKQHKKSLFYAKPNLIDHSNDSNLLIDKDKIRSWLFYSIINAIIFFPIFLWISSLNDSIRVLKLKQTIYFVDAKEISNNSLRTNIITSLFGIFTYAWLIPVLVITLNKTD